jgi:hypothetical protein
MVFWVLADRTLTLVLYDGRAVLHCYTALNGNAASYRRDVENTGYLPMVNMFTWYYHLFTLT